MPNPSSTSNADWALQYATQGLRVFPVHWVRESGECSCGKSDCGSVGKHPIPRNGCLDASVDSERIQKWWRANPNANIGCATGTASGLWVVDIEAAGLDDWSAILATEGEDTPYSPVSRTGGGGKHLFFKVNCEAINNATKLSGHAIDVRGAGGYVLLPPSNHASGQRYEWLTSLDDAEPEEAPAWLTKFVTANRVTSLTSTKGGFVCQPSGFADAPPSEMGSRHNDLAALVGREFARGCQFDEVLKAATVWAANCSPPHDEGDVRKVVEDIAGREFSRLQAAKSGSPAPSQPTELAFLPAAEFADADYRMRFLVKRVLVAGQPALIGGPKKCLKTSILCDLAVSLGTGKPFLGCFEVPEQVNVGVLSGESGGFTLQETARRIALSKGRLLSDSATWWGFDLPQLSQAADLQKLVDAIERHAFDVTIIDPAYLCLLDGGKAESAGNVFSMGNVLRTFSQVGVETGTTLVLAHHSTKAAGRSHEPLELEDLSQSGFAEWARQWMLVSRRDAYEFGTGRHDLWLSVGGSAGHSGLYGVNVDEVVLQDDFTGRTWGVVVTPAGKLFVDEAAAKAEQKRVESANVLQSRRQDIIEALRKFPEGETKTIIRECCPLNSKNFTNTFATLTADGTVINCTIEKSNGRIYDAFKLSAGTTGTATGDTPVPTAEAHTGDTPPFRGGCPGGAVSGAATGTAESVPTETWEF